MRKLVSLLLLASLISCESPKKTTGVFSVDSISVTDAFWSPRLAMFAGATLRDVLDKFEGNYQPEGAILEKDFKDLGQTRNAFLNFDLVAQGKRGIGMHHGPPWYNGLIYETIRGASDLLSRYPDQQLQQRIDGYIDRIVAAQASDSTGYLNTYTQLMEPEHRWGFNGGMQRWQHDVYNAGMMVEAGVHYYRATGKTKLLTAAVKFANCMYVEMGPEPKLNVVPAHSGPEEALIKLHQLFLASPELKKEIAAPVDEAHYLELALFWIDARGHHSGYPHWKEWGDAKSEEWIRAASYNDPKYGSHSRPTWGDYAQDSIPVLQQTTIEGHAVRATLLATGVTTAAITTGNEKYAATVKTLWSNMVGKRMFVTGGVGAIARDEKFGADYFLPNDAYLETCAAVGAGFFSQRMNELTGEGMYMDEYERSLYNNVLTGISSSGDKYTYVNPLTGNKHQRWGWHDCPCCPPMFLKMVGSMPDFIYATRKDGIAVNLFVGSNAAFKLPDGSRLRLEQQTGYPWKGEVQLTVDPEKEQTFTIRIRIPGWAHGVENPFGLYASSVSDSVTIFLNDDRIPVEIRSGYVEIARTWKKGDQIRLSLPMSARTVHAHPEASDLNGLRAVAVGPLVYGFEEGLSGNLDQAVMPDKWEVSFEPGMLGGINVIRSGDLTAIPYFSMGNLKPGTAFRVWIKE